MSQKTGFISQHSKSSAVFVSIVVHAILAFVAISFVAVRVMIKDETVFEVKNVKRPTMKLRKLQVPVNMKKTQVPKLRKTIVVTPKVPTVDIRLPEVVGVRGGLGSGAGGGFGGLGFDFDLPDLFGGNKRGNGNEFVGYFYDLKQTPSGKLSEIGELAQSGDRNDPDFKKAAQQYRKVLYGFINGGWKGYGLEDYFKAPREKYATSFIIPEISAGEAPKAFGVEKQVEPRLWVAWYQGQIAAPETGRYRFVGFCDDYLFVRVKKELVLDGSYRSITEWESSDPDNRKFETYRGQRLVIGDWFIARRGESIPVDIMLGEEPGGRFHCQLYIQQDGVEYPSTMESRTDSKTHETITYERPILPFFKTAEISEKVLEQMKVNPQWASDSGPCFGVVANK